MSTCSKQKTFKWMLESVQGKHFVFQICRKIVGDLDEQLPSLSEMAVCNAHSTKYCLISFRVHHCSMISAPNSILGFAIGPIWAISVPRSPNKPVLKSWIQPFSDCHSPLLLEQNTLVIFPRIKALFCRPAFWNLCAWYKFNPDRRCAYILSPI